MSLRITIRCPYCQSRAIARSSRELSKTMREIVYACVDPECGHTYVAQLEAVRTLSPSAKKISEVLMPISQHVRARIMEQMDLLA